MIRRYVDSCCQKNEQTKTEQTNKEELQQKDRIETANRKHVTGSAVG